MGGGILSKGLLYIVPGGGGGGGGGRGAVRTFAIIGVCG